MIVEFKPEHHQTIYDMLRSLGIAHDDIILNIDVSVLLVDNKIAGFYCGEVINKVYNLHHFYIKPEHRSAFNIVGSNGLVDHMVNRIKKLVCKYGLFHMNTGSDEHKFFLKYFKDFNKRELDLGFKGISIYKVEV